MIFSEDALSAALIGAAAELVGFEATFPLLGESPREALLRKRPPLVLVESGHGAACRPSFFGPALMTGARVVLVSTRRASEVEAPSAASFGLREIQLPADLRSIAAVLAMELEAAGR